ncbi:DUF862 domain-containing protein [Citrus sinensis]|uniref:DUF862 domain-containing protein n=3 Tax=Citrus TaxID=2706 RepID=A0ACB8MUA5_CITSI|nr:putative UPF0481 protein At3g02645 [Citrus sinensis]XP_052290548.1 putative UPF0481 protein At3g02645 [Citrus sinensis]GAY63076.1 hypothetical protein CUMW_222720 [Citrus unshiu]KAH9740774.1 DUF862 domain-containing protein [Citrus sinensis]KAH9789285.1 DUF862 domain-containing protein [Citrus sinensis]KDO62956.1 hypothetical protein CISIN_1g014290mg [Citrus sinensis]
MDDCEDVSIDMEKLAHTLSEKLETLHHWSKDCSIYRVAEPKRCLNPRHFTPQMVSIGPFHHGKEELKPMEEHKQRYLKYFLQRTKVSMASFLGFIKAKETKLRNCYAATICNLGSDEFVAMVLVDAVFLIEFFLRYYKSNLRTDDDRIFKKPKYLEIQDDFLLVENQLPLFILIDLFDLAKTATYEDVFYENISFVKITCFWFRDQLLGFLPLDENSLEIHFSKAEHFLDLIILCLQPSQSRAQIILKDQSIPSMKELHQAGVKFKPAAGSTKNLLDINFNQGILEISFFKVYDDTERAYRNLLAFERMHGYKGYFNDYIIMMACLISCPKDAELLVQNEVIRLGNTETVPTVFGKLDRDCTLYSSRFQYSGVVTDLQAYRKLPWHKWKAALKQNYFNTPWASISVIAAVILLLLTATQTVSSLIAL